MNIQIKYINISILIVLTILLSMMVIFSEKIVCYKESAVISGGVEYKEPINNGGCPIDQELLSQALGTYDTEPSILRWIIEFGTPILLIANWIFLFVPRNRKLLERKTGLRYLLWLNIVSMLFVMILLWLLRAIVGLIPGFYFLILGIYYVLTYPITFFPSEFAPFISYVVFGMILGGVLHVSHIVIPWLWRLESKSNKQKWGLLFLLLGVICFSVYFIVNFIL